MQKNSSEKTTPKGPPKAVKALLMGFVALSVVAGVYKIAGSPCCDADPEETVSSPAAVSAEQSPVPPVAAGSAAPAAKPAAGAKSAAPVSAVPAAVKKPAAPAKKAVVYYFYTSARCYSCNLLETYTREAVSSNFSEPYKGWQVEFRGINVDESFNKHFISDFSLNSKSVVVRKFEGEKPGDWKNLQNVWRMLGSKELYTGYVAGEIQGLLDAK